MYVDGMPTETPTRRLASIILEQPVDQWVTDRRTEGLSWRVIAHDLDIATGGAVVVSHETVRQWTEGTTT